MLHKASAPVFAGASSPFNRSPKLERWSLRRANDSLPESRQSVGEALGGDSHLVHAAQYQISLGVKRSALSGTEISLRQALL
jgi:hypothetical protein